MDVGSWDCNIVPEAVGSKIATPRLVLLHKFDHRCAQNEGPKNVGDSDSGPILEIQHSKATDLSKRFPEVQKSETPGSRQL